LQKWPKLKSFSSKVNNTGQNGLIQIENSCLRLVYFWQSLYAKMSVTVTTILALANRDDPICVALPKLVKASTTVTVVCRCHWNFYLKTSPLDTQLNFHSIPWNPIHSTRISINLLILTYFCRILTPKNTKHSFILDLYQVKMGI